MKILLTGASGMLGTDVQSAALARGHDVVATSHADLDIADLDAVRRWLRDIKPQVVINCAAYTRVDDAESEEEAARRTNARGPGVLGSAASAVDSWVLHISTDYVFDGTKSLAPYVESDRTNPQSVYGRTKLEGELALANAAPDAHTIVRTSWLFGNGGPCFPATILRAATTRERLRVVNDQLGCPTYTAHLADALITLAESRNLPGVVHVAGGGECAWFGFAAALVQAARAAEPQRRWAVVEPCATAEFPRPAARPAYSVMRTERGEAVPTLPDWRKGLAEYMQDRHEVAA